MYVLQRKLARICFICVFFLTIFACSFYYVCGFFILNLIVNIFFPPFLLLVPRTCTFTGKYSAQSMEIAENEFTLFFDKSGRAQIFLAFSVIFKSMDAPSQQ
jgi:hypothetical protein